MVVHQVLDSVLTKVVDYCGQERTREQLEAKVLAPAIKYIADRFSWGVRIFQVVAVLVLIQTVILLWLLLRDMRRPLA
jgi:hypothetical protein